jgi:hypothetical protein
VSVNDVWVNQALLLYLFLSLLILYLLLQLLLLNFHFFLLHNTFVLLVTLFFVLVDGDDLIQSFLVLHIEISERIGDIADINEGILLNFLGNQGFCFCSLLIDGVVALDDC